MKKQILLLLPLSLILFSCKKKEDNLRYELNLNNTYTAILDSDSTVKKVSIPKKHNGKDVTTISGFRNNSYIEEVTFTSNITKIEEGTFLYCENLKKISVSNSNYYKTIDGSLYKDDYLLIYASGKNNNTFKIDKNIKSNAFTLAPNIKELKIDSKIIEENAIYFLENIETIYLGSSVENISNSFQLGNKKLERLIINNTTITPTLELKDIKRVYVLETAELSDKFLENYEYKNTGTYENVSYKIYEVK